MSTRSVYRTYGKRAMDVLLSGIGLLILSPLLVIIAICIKLSTAGPAIYVQNRIGYRGRQFPIVKFRSMVHGAQGNGLGITASDDRRVTDVGRVLRRYKLDELPQLWNVFCGDMSLVGPRPELPVYVAGYTPEQLVVLSVRPGVTDPASIAYRHEEELLAGRENPEQFYRLEVLPDKLAQNVDYIRTISFWGDLRLIFQTIAISFSIPPRGESLKLKRS